MTLHPGIWPPFLQQSWYAALLTGLQVISQGANDMPVSWREAQACIPGLWLASVGVVQGAGPWDPGGVAGVWGPYAAVAPADEGLGVRTA